MNVIEIKNLCRKDIPLHYREEFTGLAVLEDQNLNPIERSIEFVLERTAYGTKEIEVKFRTPPDFPMIHVLNNLKTYILNLEKEGKLS